MYGQTTVGTTAVAGTLAYTGEHVAAMVILGTTLIFMGGTLVRATRHRRHSRP
jgi:hypothetical protein